MNKDLDERLVPNGQYRDAKNIQISTSDGSNIGAAQVVLGNAKKAVGSVDELYTTTVGVLDVPEKDLIYYFVAAYGWERYNYAPNIYKDLIIEYDTVNDSFKYVFVDIFKVRATQEGAPSAPGRLNVSSNGDNTMNITGARIGMQVVGTFTNTTGGTITWRGNNVANGATYTCITNDEVFITDIQIDAANNRWHLILTTNKYGENLRCTANDTYDLRADRVLNFSHNNKIPAINHLDGMIFWTDDSTEPKKINIERSIAGTGGIHYMPNGGINGFAAGVPSDNPAVNIQNNNAHFHTRLVIDKDFQLRLAVNHTEQLPIPCREQHITVIKKNPEMPLDLEMSTTAATRVPSGSTTPNSIFTQFNDSNATSVFYDTANNQPHEVGHQLTVTFNTAVDFRPGDVLLFLNDLNASPDAFPTEDALVRAVVINGPGGYPNNGGSVGPYTIEIQSVDATLGNIPEDWLVRLEQEKPLFEYKFPRFSYRWKYTDGEYSCYAPWSEIAFLPGDFDYLPKKGYNLGMRNNVRSLKLTRYFQEPSNTPEDVIGVELLYKETNKAEVYTIKELTMKDGPPFWPAWNINFYNRGEYEITSEIIHAIVPSNQLLRPYDNVPRRARAQEITGNRLVYGNYLQNYNISAGSVSRSLEIDVNYASELIDNSINPDGIETPTLSCKTMRTYQVGVVFRDKYGRETPVQVPKSGGSVTIPKKASTTANQITATLRSDPPFWAESFKYYIKETSNEYYNLAMDRFYDAEDGNVWISFPSAERNKITEDTYLILKKQHDSDIAVIDQARYKVISIAEEPPTFIKQYRKSYGMAHVDYAAAGAPEPDKSFILVRKDDFLATFSSVVEPDLKEDLELRIGGTSGGTPLLSNFYDVVSIAVPSSGTWVKITIAGKFENDCNQFVGLNLDNDLKLEILQNTLKHKPEFDGRFFVKIYKDLILQNKLLNNFTTDLEYAVVDTMRVGFLNDHNGSGESFWSDWKHTNYKDQYDRGNQWFYDDEDYQDDSYYPTPGFCKGGCFDHAGNAHFDISFANFHQDSNPVGYAGNIFQVPYTRLTNIGGLIRFAEDPAQTIWEIVQVRGRLYTNLGAGMNYFGGESGSASSPLVGGTGDSDWNWSNSDSNSGNQRFGIRVKLRGYRDLDNVDVTGLGTHDEWFSPNRVDANGDSHYFCPIASGLVGGNSYWMQPDGTLAVRTAQSATCSHSSGIFNGMTHPTIDGFSANPRNDSTIEFMEPFIVTDSEGAQEFSSNNPAIWETEPKENVELDIYYEASAAIPVKFSKETNEMIVPYKATFEHGGTTHTVTSLSDNNITFTPALTAVIPEFDPALPSITGNESSITIYRYDGSKITSKVNVSGNVPVGATTIQLFMGDNPRKHDFSIVTKNATHHQTYYLGWWNCWAWGNGVESDRIRDDFNAPQLDNGVKASASVAEPYKEEHRKNGFIWSGIFNSISGVNNLNQFIAAEPITKDLNPGYGSIQKMHARNTDTVAFCEDKVLIILTNKDALFNADGNSNVTATARVLGAATPIQGEYGISTDPMSFAKTPFGAYWCDQMRGQVLGLQGQSSISVISDVGMKDYFNDNLQGVTDILGTYDGKKNEYNLTFGTRAYRSQMRPSGTTVSWNEDIKGWVSFKSFDPENGISLNNEYYTFKFGQIWKHHQTINHLGNPNPNNMFYGIQYYPSIKLLFNDDPGSVKSFGTVNYEGTQSRITAFVNPSVTDAAGNTFNIGDREYYNLTQKQGWYIDSSTTNLQSTENIEFKEKEGKWFSTFTGATTLLSNLDEKEFSVQGIGMATQETVVDSGTNRSQRKFTFNVTNNTATGGGTYDATADSGWTTENVSNQSSHTDGTTVGTNNTSFKELTITNIVNDEYTGINLDAFDFTIGGDVTITDTTFRTIEKQGGGSWNATAGVNKIELFNNGVAGEPTNTIKVKVYYDNFTITQDTVYTVDLDKQTVSLNTLLKTPFEALVQHDGTVGNFNLTIANVNDINRTTDSKRPLKGHDAYVHTGNLNKGQTTLWGKYTFTASNGYYFKPLDPRNPNPVDVDYTSTNRELGKQFDVKITPTLNSANQCTVAVVEFFFTPLAGEDDQLPTTGSFADFDNQFTIRLATEQITQSGYSDNVVAAIKNVSYRKDILTSVIAQQQLITIQASAPGRTSFQLGRKSGSGTVDLYYNFATDAWQAGASTNTVDFTKDELIKQFSVFHSTLNEDKTYSVKLIETTGGGLTHLDVPTSTAGVPDAFEELTYKTATNVTGSVNAVNTSGGTAITGLSVTNNTATTKARVPQFRKPKALQLSKDRTYNTINFVYTITGEGKAISISSGNGRQPVVDDSGSGSSHQIRDVRGAGHTVCLPANSLAPAGGRYIYLDEYNGDGLKVGMGVSDVGYERGQKSYSGTILTASRIASGANVTAIDSAGYNIGGTNYKYRITISADIVDTGAAFAQYDKIEFTSDWSYALRATAVQDSATQVTVTVSYIAKDYGDATPNGAITLYPKFLNVT
tara:strand:- start:6689 stop:14155 length:7467 start_codon:yes stop_codon:yes gene_type:complete